MPQLKMLPVSKRPYRFDSRIVVLYALVTILLCKCLTESWQLGLVEVVLLALVVANAVDVRKFFLTSLIVLPFTLAALPLIFTVEGPIWFRLGEWSASYPGFHRFSLVVLHSFICYQVLILASVLLGANAFVDAAGRLGLPARLVSMLKLALRYLELLMEEASRMERARWCRSGTKKLSLMEKARTTGHLVGSLFLRTWDRAERVQMAIKCRGGPISPGPSNSSPAPWSHWAGLLILVAFSLWMAVSGA